MRRIHQRTSVIASLSLGALAVGCGSSPTAPPRVAVARAELPTPPPPAGASDEVRTALGTVASTLPLRDTDIVASAPLFGEVSEGPEMARVHDWSPWAEGTGSLYVVSWLAFHADDADRAELAPDGPVHVWRWPGREQTVGSDRLSGGPGRSARVSVSLVERAVLVAAPRGGDETLLALACLPDDAACLAADLDGAIDTLARSLRARATVGEGNWQVRVPGGPSTDAVLSLTLPGDLVGLPLRRASGGDWHAPIVSRRTGSVVLRLVMGLDTHGGTPEPCAPYACAWQTAAEPDPRVPAILAGIVREQAGAEAEEIPLIEGRLALRTSRPFVHRPADAYWGVGPTAEHDSLARLTLSATTTAAVEIRARDSLRAMDWPPAWPLDVGVSFLRETDVEEIPSGDEAFSVFAERRVRDERFRIFVVEHLGTAIELSVRLAAISGPAPEHATTPDDDASAAARAIAAGLRRLGPPRTTDHWHTQVGDLAFDVDLPADFARSRDEVLDEGWAEEAAIHVGLPAAELAFLEGEPLPRRAPRRRRTVTLGTDADAIELTFGAHPQGRGEAWLARAPCRCRMQCLVAVRGDEPQREELLSVLAGARVTRRVGTVEDVHLRAAPADDAPEVGRIWPDREVFVRRRSDGWVEIDGRDSTSSPGRPVRGWVRESALGPHC